jgi:hypothetical protein
MYRIGNEEFELDAGGAVGQLDEQRGLLWAIDAYARRKETEEFGRVRPKLSITQLPHPTEADRHLNRLHFPNARAYDEATGIWTGDFYISGGHFFRSGILLERTSPSQFHLHWKGEVNIIAEAFPGEAFVPFEITLEIPFHGILCESTDQKTSQRLLNPICDVSSLTWIEKENEFFDCAFLSTRQRPGR